MPQTLPTHTLCLKSLRMLAVISICSMSYACAKPSVDNPPMDSGTSAGLADLELSLTVNDSAPTEGSIVTFTIVVSNQGPGAAADIIVQAPLPSGYTFAEDTGGLDYTPDNGRWVIAGLNAGGSSRLDISATVNSAGSYDNVAEIISCSVQDPDSQPGNGLHAEDDQDSASTSPVAQALTVTTLAVLNAADALAVGPDGRLYASSYGTNRIFVVDPEGGFMTHSGNHPGAAGVAFDAAGNLYLARYTNRDIVKRTGASGPFEPFVTGVDGPIALAFDSSGNLFTNNNYSNFITKIAATGDKTTMRIGVFNNSSLAIDTQDSIYISDYESGDITKTDATTGEESLFASIPLSTGGVGYITYFRGHLYATATAEGTIYVIDAQGNVDLLAGLPGVSGVMDGDADTATFANPIGIAASRDGRTLYVAQNEGDGAIRMITGFSR